MKDILDKITSKNKYSYKNSLRVNILKSLSCFMLMLFFPSFVVLALSSLTNNSLLMSTISSILISIIIFFMYYKDLIAEFHTFKSNFKENVKISFNDYFLGLALMIFFNIIIAFVLRHISTNESEVRNLLYSNVVLTLINISIVGPICEELVFRKSLAPVFKNKWAYVIVSGLLFGIAHLLTNFFSGTFVLSDLIYILPYGSFGACFALMDYRGKNTYNSIMMHAIHNTATGILLLIVYFSGVIS